MSEPRIGLLFPGQGAQHVGMGRDLAERFPEARRIWDAADDLLGFRLSALSWDGPEDELTHTRNAQPAIFVHSAAAWSVLAARLPSVVAAAGHSLGEFSAHFAAGTFTFEDGLRTVRRRGELMFAEGQGRPGTMAAVLGLDDAVTDEVCRAASLGGEVVVPANFNAPGQIVISGDPAAVARAADAARGAGAKRVLPLSVSGAFHSPLMAGAESRLRDSLEAVHFGAPAFPVISNVSASPVTEGTEARDLLVRQLVSPVRWTDSVVTLRGLGVTSFLEIGPGNVLTGLLKRIDRSIEGRSLGTADEIESYLRAEA